MFSVKREREEMTEPHSASKRKALGGLVIGTGHVECYGEMHAQGEGMDMEMGIEEPNGEQYSNRMVHQASSASLNSAFSFASASGPATPSDYNPSYPDHSTYTNPSGQSYIFPTTSHPHQQTKEDPYAAQYAMQAQQQQTQGPLSVHPPTANEGEARAFAEYVHAHGLPMAQAQLAMNGGVIQVVSPVDGFTYGADGTRELYSPSADYLRARYGVPSLLQNS